MAEEQADPHRGPQIYLASRFTSFLGERNLSGPWKSPFYKEAETADPQGTVTQDSAALPGGLGALGDGTGPMTVVTRSHAGSKAGASPHLGPALQAETAESAGTGPWHPQAPAGMERPTDKTDGWMQIQKHRQMQIQTDDRHRLAEDNSQTPDTNPQMDDTDRPRSRQTDAQIQTDRHPEPDPQVSSYRPIGTQI